MGRKDTLGEFEQVVMLAVVRLGGDGYGVTIRREIEQRTGRRASLGAVYATLVRLEAKGLIASREGEATSVRGGRARRHYGLRPAGARALRASRAMLDRMWDGVELDPGPERA